MSRKKVWGRRRKWRVKIGVIDKSHIYGPGEGKKPSGREAKAKEVGGKWSKPWTRRGIVANSA